MQSTYRKNKGASSRVTKRKRVKKKGAKDFNSLRSSHVTKGRPSPNGSVRRVPNKQTKTSAKNYQYRPINQANSNSKVYSERINTNRDNQYFGYRTGQSTPLHSTRVANVTKRRNRALKKNRDLSPKMRLIVVLCCMVIVAFGVGGFFLYQSDLFKVEQVSVSGVTHLTDEEMTQLASIPKDTTLLRIDTGQIESNLKSNPWVYSVSVERVFPDTINLNITERSIAAIVDVRVDDSGTTETWALSSDGMWLMEIPDRDSEEAQQISPQIYEDADNALYITDVPYGSIPEAGKLSDNANIENALGIIDGMSTELADQVKYVAASDADSTTLTLDNGIEIAFGDSTNIRDKERVVLQLMSEHEGQISYINVRSPSDPIWRSL